MNQNEQIEEVVIRPEVAKFAQQMEHVLRENDHKTGWNNMDCDELLHRIRDEVKELSEACYKVRVARTNIGKHPPDYNLRVREMEKEAIDVANFCMFLYHNYPSED